MLISLKQVFVICFVLLKTVSSSPVEVIGSDNRTYVIAKDQKYNWVQALHECGRRNKELLAIDTWDKREFIRNLLSTTFPDIHDTWLGATDAYNPAQTKNRPFYWTSTGIQTNVEFFDEAASINVDSKEHCLHMIGYSRHLLWDDADCKTKFGFICEEVDSE